MSLASAVQRERDPDVQSTPVRRLLLSSDCAKVLQGKGGTVVYGQQNSLYIEGNENPLPILTTGRWLTR
jgi:hypothetical protein